LVGQLPQAQLALSEAVIGPSCFQTSYVSDVLCATGILLAGSLIAGSTLGAFDNVHAHDSSLKGKMLGF
jgi:hypothetical protein